LGDVYKRQLLKQIVKNGNLVYSFPLLKEVRIKTKKNLQYLPPEYKRLINPHIYPVGISENLKKLKEKLSLKIKRSI
ncbi:MAG: nicotinate phosphoribosyltransferase, partial [Endomicrobia bacterium]|nr:nicotinate phosphoribosyltransferase [Endomicrobiia bacterium]